MENALDALYIGFAVLAFVVALSLSIFAFSTVTNASQQIIDLRDKENTYMYVEPQGTTREVTVEDIVPTLYRAYYENYMVRFEGIGNADDNLFKITVEEKDADGNLITVSKETSTIDLQEQKIGNQKDANKLINSLLDGSFDDLLSEDRLNPERRFKCFEESYLQNIGLYDRIKSVTDNSSTTIIEKIGLFYVNDRDNPDNTIDDVNKTKKRIITYSVKSY